MTRSSSKNSGTVPPSIEQFLLECVATHEQLQCLMWLLENPERSVTAVELEAEIGISELEVHEALEDLVDVQLVARTGSDRAEARYRYAPAHSDLDAKTRLLAILHDENRFEVVRVMGDNAIKRMWNAARVAFLAAVSSESGISAKFDRAPASSRRGESGVAPASTRSTPLDGKRRSNPPEPAWKISSPRDAAKSAQRRQSRRVER